MGVITSRLGEDLKDAMRAGDAVRRDEIRGVLAQLKAEKQAKLARELQARGLLAEEHGPERDLTPQQQAEAERLRAEVDLTEEEEQAVLQQRLKQHRQSIESFQKGSRQDLVAMEEAQVGVLEQYLPKQLGGEELDAAVRTAIAESGAQSPRDMRLVMPLLSERLRGRADMKQVSARVQALLASGSGAGA